MTTQNSEYIYWYVTYETATFNGYWILQQVKNPDGLNLAEAYVQLKAMLGIPVLVRDWKEITKKRYEQLIDLQYGTYVSTATQEVKQKPKEPEIDPSKPKRPNPFTVIKGGKPD